MVPFEALVLIYNLLSSVLGVSLLILLPLGKAWASSLHIFVFPPMLFSSTSDLHKEHLLCRRTSKYWNRSIICQQTCRLPDHIEGILLVSLGKTLNSTYLTYFWYLSNTSWKFLTDLMHWFCVWPLLMLGGNEISRFILVRKMGWMCRGKGRNKMWYYCSELWQDVLIPGL